MPLGHLISLFKQFLFISWVQYLQGKLIKINTNLLYNWLNSNAKVIGFLRKRTSFYNTQNTGQYWWKWVHHKLDFNAKMCQKNINNAMLGIRMDTTGSFVFLHKNVCSALCLFSIAVLPGTHALQLLPNWPKFRFKTTIIIIMGYEIKNNTDEFKGVLLALY